MVTNVTLGADPELFVTDADGRVSSGIGLIGGTKEAPLAVSSGALQEDNVLAEFNIDPARSEDEWVGNIQRVTEVLKAVLPYGFDILPIASHEYTQEELESFGEQALVFGCDPDLCAYSMMANPTPDSKSTLRTAGGHIHVGYDNPDEDKSVKLALAMDLMLGVPSILIDKDDRRRNMYGKAGAFRFKPYGMEYRTLSNFWLVSEERLRWAYRQTIAAVELVEKGAVSFESIQPDVGIPIFTDDVEQCINRGDKELAKMICNAANIQLVE